MIKAAGAITLRQTHKLHERNESIWPILFIMSYAYEVTPKT